MSMALPKWGLVAALLTRTSRAPKRSIVASTAASACSGSPALAAKTSTSPASSAAAFSSGSCFRDDSITLPPDSAMALAIANPIPLDAPVTSAVFPSSRSSMPADSRSSRICPGIGGRDPRRRCCHTATAYLAVMRSDLDDRVDALASTQLGILARHHVLHAGGSDHYIDTCVQRKRWQLLHPGVYLTGSAPPTWLQRQLAACWAAGPQAVASPRG